MATQTYAAQAGRVNTIKGEILAHSIPKEVLGITGQIKKMPKNEGDTIKYRRWLPQDATNNSTDGYGNRFITGSNVDTFASNHQTTEGVTPTASSMTATDVTATLVQYSCLYTLTDKTADLYEDDVAAEMKKQTGERMGLVREMIRYGKLKAATNKYYAGGTSYATVDETLSLPLLRRVSRNLLANHADQINEVIEASTSFHTTPVESGFLVFCHTDMEPAIRDLPGFKHVSEYANRSTINENEIGSVERYRFILSPELAPWYGSNTTYRGALIGATGLQGTSSYIDVYPCIVVADKAWGDVALRGMGSFDMTYLPVDQKDKNDPLGQRGYIGAKFYSAAEILNQGYMAVVFAGTPDLA